MVRGIMQTVGKIYNKIPVQYHDEIRPYFSEDVVYIITKKLGIDSDIGLATSIIFFVVGICFGWFGGHLRLRAFFWGSITLILLTNIIVMIGYKAWIGHYLYLPQFWVNVPLMLLPVAGILYQLRDYLKIVGRGKIKYHLTFKELSPHTGGEPFVSLHIPSYNEEPDMLIKTIEHVTQLNYRNYELIIIENNTRDENVWKPVEKFVKELGKDHIRFYHFDTLEGYKS